MQQMMQQLLAKLEEINTKMDAKQAAKARMEARLDASHKKMMDMLDAHRERIMASLGKTEATYFKENPEEMESVTEHRELPNEEAAVKSSATMKRRRRVQNLAPERRQKRKEPGESWIQEKVGCRLQEGVPPCKSDMAKKEPLQECSDPKKVRTAEGIGCRTQECAPPCKSGMAQEEHSQKRVHQGQCGTRNPERTDVQEETSAGTEYSNGIRSRGVEQVHLR
jgi:hypothetical protein